LAVSTTLTMPAANTSVTATYQPATYTLAVNNGTGSGTYTNGQVVSIVANAPPAGQVFDQWLGATVANAFASSTTLTMPAANTSVYATYKTAPLPLAITTSSPLPDGKVGVAYSQTLLATNGTPGYAWSIFSGALPGGLTLNAVGSISGAPTSAGGFNFTAQVSDSASATATKAFAITVNPVINNITFTPTNGPVATVVTISGSGFTGTTAVLFNGVNTGFTSTGDTQIIAAVPFGATTGSITIIGAGGAVPSLQPFTVTPSTELPAIYVADTNNHRIQKSTDGLTWTQIGLGYGTGLGQFRYPEAVAASGDGQTIYVADKSNNRIQKSTDGGATWTIFADSTLVNGPQGVALAINGDVYVSSTAGNSVLRFAGGNPAARTIIASNGTSSGAVTQVKAPYGLAVDAENTLYIADRNNYRILRIDHADTSVASVVVAGRGSLLSPGQVSVPQGVGLDNAGNLYVADSGNNRVLKFAAGNPGVAVALATNGTSLSPAQVRGAEGVTVSLLPSGPFAGQHLLVVGDTGNYRIVGKPLTEGMTAFTSFGGNGTAVGQFKSPGKIR
jgi:sugar lactone lactonase YvrE